MNLLALIAISQTQHLAEITWYGGYFHGRKTASGRRYNMHEMTCAVVYAKGSKRPAIPFRTKIKVEYGGKSVIVVITDTGSHKPKSKVSVTKMKGGKPVRVQQKVEMWFDLSRAAFSKLAPLSKGHFVAKWEIVK